MKRGLPSRRDVAGRAIAPGSSSLVRHASLGGPLPLVIEPSVQGVDLIAWAGAARAELERHLDVHGAILFRGFDLPSEAAFERFVELVSGAALDYRERSSPRTRVDGHVYTSTEYPADQEIFFHNENSYAHTFPFRLFFRSVVAAEQGGETPIADVRRVLARIDPEVRRDFETRGVLYVRNLSDVLGMSWRTAFQTDDRAEVERLARDGGYELEWLPDDRLRTRRIGPAVLYHPRTKEPVWFNHAAFFHDSTLPAEVRQAMRAQLAPDELPNQTFFGDGTAIADAVAAHLRAC
jgi:hypothetical protein